MLDEHEVALKKTELKDLVIEDRRRIEKNSSLGLCDVVPPHAVQCSDKYTDDGEKVWLDVSLRESFDEDGNMTRDVADYIRHVKHTEETEKVLKDSNLVYDPFAAGKLANVNNIEFVPGQNQLKDSQFISFLRRDLRLRGYLESNATMPSTVKEKRALLLKCLKTGVVIRCHRNALKIDEDAAGTRWANPGICVPCYLHTNNRVG